MKWFFVFLIFQSFFPAHAQNLMEERIWKVSPRKKSIFLDSGVFHHSATTSSEVVGIRNSSVDGRGYERLVFDFSSKTLPKVYGHILSSQKISLDFFDTKVQTSQPSLKPSKFIKDINFISVDGKNLTLEVFLKGKSSFDIFYLENPARLVIDIR
jgi:hypothetical protein